MYWVKDLKMEPYELEHELYFDGRGKWDTHSITFPKSVVKKIRERKLPEIAKAVENPEGRESKIEKKAGKNVAPKPKSAKPLFFYT